MFSEVVNWKYIIKAYIIKFFGNAIFIMDIICANNIFVKTGYLNVLT